MRCCICTGEVAPWERRRIEAELAAAGLTKAEASIAHKRCYLVNRQAYTLHASWALIIAEVNVDSGEE